MIHYLKGDATQPAVLGKAILVHVCNDIGAWGAGFVLAISKRWPKPEAAYRSWANGEIPDLEFKLGNVQFVPVSDKLQVANMIGQRDIRKNDGDCPVRYHAIRKCLAKVREEAVKQNASVHMPRIGCGLAGGLWEEVEDLVLTELVNHGVAVYVYDFS